jgi:hypothetical protein
LPSICSVFKAASPAAALEEDVRRGARVQCGLELAVQILVLDRLDFDLHIRVGGLEVGDRLVPERPARSRGGVVPELHRDRATVAGAVAVVIATSASGQGHGAQRHHGSQCERFLGCHEPTSWFRKLSKVAKISDKAMSSAQ